MVRRVPLQHLSCRMRPLDPPPLTSAVAVEVALRHLVSLQQQVAAEAVRGLHSDPQAAAVDPTCTSTAPQPDPTNLPLLLVLELLQRAQRLLPPPRLPHPLLQACRAALPLPQATLQEGARSSISALRGASTRFPRASSTHPLGRRMHPMRSLVRLQSYTARAVSSPAQEVYLE